MKLTHVMLGEAAAKGLLTSEQGQALWGFLVERERETPSFKPAHILYYLGGLFAIGAMTLFMTLGWERFGGGGLLLISASYCGIALAMTEYFASRGHLAIPAGITGALAVVMVPLAVYGGQHLLGFWPAGGPAAYRDFHTHIDWRWLLMELATLAAGAAALQRYRLPFMVLPVAVTLWYMGMDIVPFLFGGDSVGWFSETSRLISMWFGVVMTLVAFWVDMRSRGSKDFAFWLYVFGVLTFWGGFTCMNAGNEFGKFFYGCVNLGMIAIGAVLSRRVFAVFGGLGIAGYLGHLAYTVFQNSMLFPVALTAIGFGVIAMGIYWQRHEAAISAGFRPFLCDLMDR